MSTRLRSSKRARRQGGAASDATATPTRGGKRQRRSKAATVPAAATIADSQQQQAAAAAREWRLEGEAERVDIKVEPLDLTSDAEDDDDLGRSEQVDVKPDVHALQQLYLQQQQQHHQQLLAATAGAAPLPGGGKQVYIIGDLATLTSLANSGNAAALSCLTSGGAAGGSFAVGSAAPAQVATALPSTTNNAAQLTTTATSTASTTTSLGGGIATPATPTSTGPLGQKAPPTLDFVKDEFDLQVSDLDEDGYSDVRLDDDDNEFVEEEGEFDLYDPMWTEVPTGARLVFQFERHVNDVGLEGRPKLIDAPFYFGKMLGDYDVFFGLLATGTNERVHQLFDVEAADTEPCIREEITSDDMRHFVGLCLEMSTLQLPTLAEYWQRRAHCGFSGFEHVMSERRFRLILRALNFEHIGLRGSSATTAPPPPIGTATAGDGANGGDALGELRPLVDFFNQRMADVYKCGQRLVLNDPLVFWQGRCHWQRAMSERFRCNAVSLHLLTEYTGLVLRIVPDVEGAERKRLTRDSKLLAQHRAALARGLLHDMLGQGHTVYTSKYYSSCGLAYELANARTYSTGLLDARRYGNCKQLILMPLRYRTFGTRYASPLMMGKWRRAKKCVYFHSTDCLAIYANETAWRSKDRRPKIIRELEWQLQLPDTVRRAMVHYQLALAERADIKWDRQLAVFVFNVMLLNAYSLYTIYAPIGRSRVTDLHLKDTTKLKTYAEFRQELIATLLSGTDADDATDNASGGESGKQPKQKRQTKRSSKDKEAAAAAGQSDDCAQDGSAEEQAAAAATAAGAAELPHRVAEIARCNGKVLKKKCRVCRKAGMLTFSRHLCEQCPGLPGLCETPCFDIWHDQLKRKERASGSRKQQSASPDGRIRVRNFDSKTAAAAAAEAGS